MTKFLRKLFIKNYENTGDSSVRSKHGVLAAIGGIITNLLLFIFKLLVGLLSASMSIVSDALNNLSDLFSCFVNLVGFKMSGKPADKKHPYGHERMEYIAGMIISFIIICVAAILGFASVEKLIARDEATQYSVWMFAVLGGAIIVKLLLGLFYRGLGKAIGSVALKASMQDSLNDMVSTGVVLIAAVVQYFVPSAWWLDGSMSLVVAVYVFYSGIKMTVETASPLVGLPPEDELVQNIIRDVLGYSGILGVHDVICHSYGPTKIFMTLHAEVDGYADTFESHDVIDKIETEISEKYSITLTVHMDPLDTRNEEIPKLKERLTEILDATGEDICFHDLRMVAGPTHTKVIFDIVLPCDIKIATDALKSQISEKMGEINKKYISIINIDRDYSK